MELENHRALFSLHGKSHSLSFFVCSLLMGADNENALRRCERERAAPLKLLARRRNKFTVWRNKIWMKERICGQIKSDEEYEMRTEKERSRFTLYNILCFAPSMCGKSGAGAAALHLFCGFSFAALACNFHHTCICLLARNTLYADQHPFNCFWVSRLFCVYTARCSIHG